MRASTLLVTVSALLALGLPADADPPARGRTVVEPGGGGTLPPEALHAYVLDAWQAAQPAQPAPVRLGGVLGPGPALAAASTSAACAPLPGLHPVAAVALYNVALEPEPSDALVAVATRNAQSRADSAIDQALGAGATWRLDRPFATQRGTLPQPVAGEVATPFGPVRVAGLYTTVRHPGQTWRVPSETSVRTVARGIVRHTGELNGHGLVVIMDHGTGYHTVYANLTRVDVGDRELLEGGDTIGTVGLGEPAARTLYFEVRHLGDPLDPADWLTPPR